MRTKSQIWAQSRPVRTLARWLYQRRKTFRDADLANAILQWPSFARVRHCFAWWLLSVVFNEPNPHMKRRWLSRIMA